MIGNIITALLFILFSSLHSLAESKPENVEKYEKLLIQNCKADKPNDCVKIGLDYLSGDILPKNKEKALIFFQRACDKGLGEGCAFFGYSKYESTHRENREYAKAREYYSKGCNLGNGWSCSWLGMHFEMAWGISQDLDLARSKYKQGCELADYAGCTSVGRMYELGIGISVNDQLSQEFYGKACKLGNKYVCEKFKQNQH
jgi:TPR repeat protein